MASIRERNRADGTTVHAVLWRDTDTGKQTSYNCTSADEAKRFKRLVEANNNSLSAVERILEKITVAGPTVKQNMIRHIELLTSAGPDTLKRYKAAVVNHFSGKLGNLPVAAVEYEDVIEWVRAMQGKTYKGKKLSAKTIGGHHALLSASMETAIRLKRRGDNPCKGVKLPKDQSTREKMRFLTSPQVTALVLAMPPRYRPFVGFLAATGMRFGEATALVGRDFEMDAQQPSVRVEKAWKRGEDGSFYVGPPKTKKSRRTVSLSSSTVRAVQSMLENVGPNELVFTTSYGGPIRHSSFHEFWSRALDSLGYPKDERPRIHDLRHTHASLMLMSEENFSIFELSRRLGHENIQTTVDRYSHLVPDAHWRGAQAAERAIPLPILDDALMLAEG